MVKKIFLEQLQCFEINYYIVNLLQIITKFDPSYSNCLSRHTIAFLIIHVPWPGVCFLSNWSNLHPLFMHLHDGECTEDFISQVVAPPLSAVVLIGGHSTFHWCTVNFGDQTKVRQVIMIYSNNIRKMMLHCIFCVQELEYHSPQFLSHGSNVWHQFSYLVDLVL